MDPEEEEEEEDGQIVSLGDSRIERVRGRLAILSMLKVRVVDLEKMYCVMRASAPSLYNVYRRYDTTVARSKIQKCDTGCCPEAAMI